MALQMSEMKREGERETHTGGWRQVGTEPAGFLAILTHPGGVGRTLALPRPHLTLGVILRRIHCNG